MEHYLSNDKFDEDKYTIKMMDKYGINNVRLRVILRVEAILL